MVISPSLTTRWPSVSARRKLPIESTIGVFQRAANADANGEFARTRARTVQASRTIPLADST
jgi:hypothetical protein